MATQYTPSKAIPYPDGESVVATHKDIQNAAQRADVVFAATDISIAATAAQASSAVSTANNALTVAGGAEADADNAVDRVTALESAAGFGPSTPTDGTMASFIANPASLTASQLSTKIVATTGRVYRPEFYGAVGDGVADDLPAFRAMESAINAAPNVPAKIEITRKHRLSDGVNFDVENIECYLAEGSHVFTTAPTTPTIGHTLGFIGFYGSGTAVTPQRGSCAILGPGKVTGYLGGTATNNENAIGVVRYKNVLVDGPKGVEAGNKGFTAQYGIDHVKIRNFGVKRANFRAISIEDGTLTIDVDGVTSESTGGAAVVISAENMTMSKIDVGLANTNGGITEAAVRATGVAVKSVQFNDIAVGDAGVGKGVIIANATGVVLADKIRVGSSGGSAVELQNCTGTNYVGVVDAPASPNRVVAVGTTPAAGIKRIGQPDPDVITIPASRLGAVAGSPTIGAAGASLPGYLLDSVGVEAVAALLGRETIPASWRSFAVDIAWTNTTTNAGNVRHDASYGWLADGDAFTTGTYVAGAAQSAPTAHGTLKVSRLIASITPPAAKDLYLRIIRNGSDASDTLINDSGLVSVKLVRLA